MTVIKCKMCGANIDITPEANVYKCNYCETVQTVPTADDEKKITIFTRANRLRAACDFDRAAAVYESIVAEFPEEAEAYWGLVLCKYGIEYVDDPATRKKIPTCHRSSFDCVMEDNNLDMALEYADINARGIYREEAKAIEELRKNIISISSREEPYDIFICYKETDRNGLRTVDSVIAQDIYTLLTEKGYKVFFSRISLEDKLGQEYEPYIFASLNSSKIMLVFGTDYEHFNAVWVKNEWMRFLHLIEGGAKKTLIPCYKDIDAYDMPKEFARLQAQDMGKVGAVQDLLRGIEKILPKEKRGEEIHTETENSTIANLLTRMNFFLEDKDWKAAEEYSEKILDLDPKNAYAYLGKLLAQLQLKKHSDLVFSDKPLTDYTCFNRSLQFAPPQLNSILCNYKEQVFSRLEREKNLHIEEKRKKAEEERLAEERRTAAERMLKAFREEEKKKELESLCCKIKFEVTDNINPLALANGTKYIFTVSSDKMPPLRTEVIAGKGTVAKLISVPEASYTLKVDVYGSRADMTKPPIHSSAPLNFTTKKNKTSVFSANRPGLTSSLKITGRTE